MKIFCTGCNEDVEARLTNGQEVYPHRPDLYTLPFWKCDKCGNCVGCHYKTAERTKPLGIIATKELKQMRMAIHEKLDPIWKNGKISRKKLYSKISQIIGCEYHTGSLRNMEMANKVYLYVCELSRKNVVVPINKQE